MNGMRLWDKGDFKMKVLIAGAGGLIGSAVASYLSEQGHEISRLVRRDAGQGEVRWDPDGGTVDATGLEGFNGVVHVASISWSSRWTSNFKQRIRDNHVGTIRLIAEALANCQRKPGVLICATGMGIYPSSANIKVSHV
jgi:NAD dependent epimerase/dehydratase family enzyme